MNKSGIQWTDYTVNPLKGCSPKMDELQGRGSVMSPACRHCYAAEQAYRLEHDIKVGNYDGSTKGSRDVPRWTGKIRFYPEELLKIDSTKKPGRVFICSMSDLFHEKVDEDWIDAIFVAMIRNPRHVFYVLTKRPERMATYEPPGGWPYNIIAGTTAEDQVRFDPRWEALRECGARHKFLSLEPLLGPIHLAAGDRVGPLTGIDLAQVIVGGESGKHANPTHPADVRYLWKQCRENRIPFFFKQWGRWRPVDYHDGQRPLGHDETLVQTILPGQEAYLMRAERYDAVIDGDRFHQAPDIAREVAHV